MSVSIGNKKESAPNDSNSDHAKIVGRRRKAHADGVKVQNEECMEEREKHVTLVFSHFKWKSSVSFSINMIIIN